MAATSEGARLVRVDDLRRCLAAAFERLELTAEDADELAGLLVDSELRGHPDHGVGRSRPWPVSTATER
jgi:LDH2 family malate/lactate/ureidoglycolate dehydrogenase